MTWILKSQTIAAHGQQRYRAEEVYETRSTGRTRTIRLRVESNPYRFQCEAVADLFNGAQWHRIAELPTGAITVDHYAVETWVAATPATKRNGNTGELAGEVTIRDCFRADLAALKAAVEAVLLDGDPS